MKTAILISAAILSVSALAYATPVDDMVKQGFACEPGTRGEVVCRKEGAPSKVCNAEGSCFRIVREVGKPSADGMTTASIDGNPAVVKPKH